LLLGLLCRAIAGTQAALIAVLLFAVSPSGPQWALKVSGGHQVAVCLSMLVAWLALGERRWIGALVAAPAAVLAHPIVAPFIAALCVGVIWQRKGRQRVTAALLLAGASALWAVLLWPPARSFHDPSSNELAIWTRLSQVPQLALGLFSPNLNSPEWPTGFIAVVAALWLGACLAAWFPLRRLPNFWIYALAPWGVLAIVHPLELAPRHLLLLVSLSCLFLGIGSIRFPRLAMGLLSVLVLAGVAVHVQEMNDPFVYGPGGQYLGLERDNVRQLVGQIEKQGTRYIYCADEMLAWNLMFESRGEILVRSEAPRLPQLAREIDTARRRGEPIALILANRERPVRFGVVFNPNPKIISDHFPPLKPQKK
jgi:hypothetical protein